MRKRSKTDLVQAWLVKARKDLHFAKEALKQGEEYADVGDDVYKRVDQDGNLIGFAILNFRKHERKARRIDLPFELELK